MINLNFDRFDFASAVEGFANGSHLRQHVWREHVFRSIQQMTDDEMDFLWFIFRRNLWDCYFREREGMIVCEYGSNDYLHALAALHRGNRYYVTFKHPQKKDLIEVTCYRFNGYFRPLYHPDHEDKQMADFEAAVPDEWIIEKTQHAMPENRHIQDGREDWWTNLSVYENLVNER